MRTPFSLDDTSLATKLGAAAFFFGWTVSASLAQQVGSADDYQRGYLWGQMHKIVDTSTCVGISDPFTRGCAAFVADQRRVVQRSTTRSVSSTPGADTMANGASCGASARLRQASNQLANCAKDLSSSDDCRSKYRDVRDAYDVYSAAVIGSNEVCR